MPSLEDTSSKDATPSWLNAVPNIVADEIFSLAAEYRLDQNPQKVDLLIGAYRSDDGNPCPLPSVLEAERRLLSQNDLGKHEYLPIEGDATYLRLAQKLLLGQDDQSELLQRTVSVQSVSGSGAIHIGAAFLSRFLSPGCVWVSDPTWGPHILMFERMGVKCKKYPYYDPATRLLNFQGMIDTFESQGKPGDVIILQVCAHNPTGLDLSQEQWKAVAEICQRKGILPFFDNAYQGFATGSPEKDAWPLRYFASLKSPLTFCVAQSFSKNFGLYGQRTGAFHFIMNSKDTAIQSNILQQLRFIIRTEYSTPPRTGCTFVKTILGDPELKSQWLRDVSSMSKRLGQVRSALHDGLNASDESGDFDHIIKQSGMFSYTGLNPQQVLRLKNEYHVYLSSSGRISMAGPRAAKYFNEVVTSTTLPGATEDYQDRDDLAYALSKVPMLTPRKLKVIAVGAGFGGVDLAPAVRVGKLPGVDLTIYEKNADIGETWHESRYPGCACDVPAHSYQYTWAPNPHWSHFYAPAPEIKHYFDDCADQHDLRSYFKLSHKTDGRDVAISSPGVTDGETNDAFIDECDVFVNATGFFNNWKWPRNVPGRETFRGTVFHTANWPSDWEKDIEGKTVLPAILDKFNKIYVHIRSPTWITSRIGEKFAEPKGSEWAKHPERYLEFRKSMEDDVNTRFKLFMDHTPEQKLARQSVVGNIKAKLDSRPDLAKFLEPDFAVGYFWGDIAEFTPNGILTKDGRESKVDSIICATGFELSYAPRFPILGKDGLNLQEVWLKAPESYLSVCAADMPNYFTILGPASSLGHGSLVTSIEMCNRFIVRMIRKLQTQNYSSFSLRPGVARAYQNHALSYLKRTVWASGCTNTYKNGTKDGELRSLHPGSLIQLFKLLEDLRYEDSEWKSLCEDSDLAFAWLANGFTALEEERPDGADLTWFVDPADREAKPIRFEASHHANGSG
ncbi:pyridoxal phosphate-dependent transferase [Fusarium oxysporum II5]|nr:pyridoxal phosphate-dependent transferase [Fusarium oxysporum II5]